MIRVNGVDFEIYSMDNEQTLRERIADLLGTQTKYLYFPNKPITEILTSYMFGKDSDTDFIVEDISTVVKGARSNSFPEIYRQIKDKVSLNSIGDIVELFISFNKDLINEPDHSLLFYFSTVIQKDVDTLLETPINVEEIIKRRSQIASNFRLAVITNKRNAEEFVKRIHQFETRSGVPFDTFQLEKIKFTITRSAYGKSLLDVFNIIQLNDTAPFASCTGYYKIQNLFLPPQEWKVTSGLYIILKVLNKQVSTLSESDYTTVTISVDETLDKTNITFEYEVESKLPKDVFVNRIMSIFGGAKSSLTDEINETGVTGVMFIPNQTLNKYVFLDIAMTDTNISKVITIDETTIPSKNTLYVRFRTNTDLSKGGIVTAFVSETGTKSDGSGTRCVKMRINTARSVDAVNTFASSISKVFSIYNDGAQEILDLYQNLGVDIAIDYDDINQQTKIRHTKTSAMSDVAPEVFVPNYSRFCGKPPRMIDDSEEDVQVALGKQVLTFPKVGDPSGETPRKYVCDHIKFSFPGVRHNTLSNADKFKYMLCCFENDQIPKPDYQAYYLDNDVSSSRGEQHIITTKRALTQGHLGTLPPNIARFFNTVETSDSFMYYRLGVARSENSFIQCVYLALKLMGLNDGPDEARELRNEFGKSEALANACRQEMFEAKSAIDVLNIINSDGYFDPNNFYRLLETHTLCKIILFNRSEDPEGIMSVPKHVYGHHRADHEYSKTIYIYENSGMPVDNFSYPQCELIVRWNTKSSKTDLTSSFELESTVTKNTFRFIDMFYKMWVGNSWYSYSKYKFPTKIGGEVRAVSQHIDSKGKTRVVTIETLEGVRVSIMTGPTQPYALPADDPKIYRQNAKNVFNVLELLGAGTFTFGTNKVYGILEDTKFEVALSENEFTDFNVTNIFANFKRQGRILTNFFIWLYSKYINKNNLRPRVENINDFVISVCNVANTEVSYAGISQYYEDNMKSKEFITNTGKLSLDSQIMLDRLVFCLKMKITTEPLVVFGLHTENYSRGEYLSVNDFEQNDQQLLLEGDDGYDLFVTHDTQYKITHSVIKESVYPYYFENKHIDGGLVYLAQNAISLEQALYVAVIYQSKGYNPGISDNRIEIGSIGFTFYAYRDENTITKHLILGEEMRTNIKIVGYRLDQGTDSQMSVFTALLV